MGKILLDLPEECIRRLDSLKQQRNMAHAELLREAVEQYLERQTQDVIAGASGLWGFQVEDGLEYERRMREEW